MIGKLDLSYNILSATNIYNATLRAIYKFAEHT